MAQKKKQVAMDIRNAVNYVEAQIGRGEGAFFINTKYGKICIEINPFPNVSSVRPVTVTLWEKRPTTKFITAHPDEKAAFYCGIDIYGTLVADHFAVVEALTRCMYIAAGFEADADMVFAAVMAYADAYDPYHITPQALTRDFIRNHMRKIHGQKRAIMEPVIMEMYAAKSRIADMINAITKDASKWWIAEHHGECLALDEYEKWMVRSILYLQSSTKN